MMFKRMRAGERAVVRGFAYLAKVITGVKFRRNWVTDVNQVPLDSDL